MVRFNFRLEHLATVPGLTPLAGLTRPVTSMVDPFEPDASPELYVAQRAVEVGTGALLREARFHRPRFPALAAGLAVMAARLGPLTVEQLECVGRMVAPVQAPLDAALAATAADLLSAIGDPAAPWDAERALDIAQCMERVQRALEGREA